MARRTINKNWHDAVSGVFARVTSCKCHCESNGFAGVECPKQVARTELMDFSGSKLYENPNGTYTVKVHSNLWYFLS